MAVVTAGLLPLLCVLLAVLLYNDNPEVVAPPRTHAARCGLPDFRLPIQAIGSGIPARL